MGRKNSISQPELGKQLLDIRVDKGLTQLELRELSHVSVRTIQRIESGAVTPRTATIKIILEALGENIEDWFGNKTNVENHLSIKTFKNMLLVNASELELKNSLTPAWIGGVVYLVMVIMEQGIGAFSEYLNNQNYLLSSMVIIKTMAAISFFLFTRGILALALLFEIQYLKIAAYVSMVFVAALYLTESALILFTQSFEGVVDLVRTLAVAPLGVISIFLGIGLLRLQDGMGRIAKVAGRLELVFGISYASLILAFVGVLLLIPLLVVEIVLLSKADQLVREGKL